MKRIKKMLYSIAANIIFISKKKKGQDSTLHTPIQRNYA